MLARILGGAMKSAVIAGLALATAALGRVIVVPDSVATIQAGLNLAGNGDTVLVQPGIYNENLVWPSVDGIKLLSSAGSAATIVDGGLAGVCLTMGSGSFTRATEVRGFTFQKGHSASGGGAGISCAGSATIAANRVTACRGVGVYLSSDSAGFSPLVAGNEIDACVKEVESWNYGAGMYITAQAGARPEICYNYIHHDTLLNSARNYGGGIYCDADALIYQNVISENVLLSDTGSACRAYGAGIFVDTERKPVIFGNLIINNRCATDAWKYGAGIRLYSGAKPLIVGNTIAGNVCEGPHIWSNGGGIYSDMRCTSYVKNNIIANNQATSGSGIYNYTSSQSGEVVSLHNSYYNNTLVGCAMGPGDITGDPLFAAGLRGGYYLSQTAAGQPQTSPCVDAGDTLEPAGGLNLDSLMHAWTTRTDSVYDLGVPDIGYHYPTGFPVGIFEAPRMAGGRATTRATIVRGVLMLDVWTQRSGNRAELLDAAGRRVLELRPGANDLSRLAPGVYFAPKAGPRRVLKF
uniref:Right handed beta helix domain-containing protein n=1 Tax=candidate division WOR-3 bacterium TaxID=2052148 RepID=A0A7C4CAD4_UNCW3